MTRRVLLTLVPERREDLDHARRRIAYDRIILATGAERRALAEAIAAEENSTAAGDHRIATLLDLPPRDPMAIHQVLQDAVHRARGDEIVLNAGGGDTAQLVALIMLAYHAGLETVLVQHGRVGRLPILTGAALPEWFPLEESGMLHALADDDTVATLDTRMGRGRAATERTLKALTRKGLVQIQVRAGHAHGALTQTGRLVLRHAPQKERT